LWPRLPVDKRNTRGPKNASLLPKSEAAAKGVNHTHRWAIVRKTDGFLLLKIKGNLMLF
jgi:hypothetical protein